MKKILRDNYRLEITPDTWGLRASSLTNHDAMRRVLADIEKAVRRHVDGVNDVAQRWDTREECSFCELEWEVLTAVDIARFPNCIQDEHSIAGEPVCCDKAIAEFRAERGIPAVEVTS